jgi:O-antigen/teichoic acid export membrane protein
MGVEALLLAHILSAAAFLIFAEVKVHALQLFDVRSVRFATFKEMMRFSVPLIPNAAFWWMTSSVNNVIVSTRLGVGVNGIYAVSNKFSSALNLVTGVLNMSWQDTAVADYGTEHFSRFLTKTFNTFIKLIFSCIAVLLPLVTLLLPHMIDPSYSDAISYTPFLLVGAGISFLSGFMGQVYTGKGKTEWLLVTSVLGMVANIAVVLLLIGKIGLWAAVLGTLLSDFTLMSTRIYFARKEFAKGIDYGSVVIVLSMLAASIMIYFKASTAVNFVWLLLSAVIAIILNRSFIKDLLVLLLGRFQRKKG